MRSPIRHALLLLLAVVAVPSIAGAQAPETIEYYATDTIGSIRIVFDVNGTVLGRQDFTPFGTPVVPAAPMPKERFAGNEKDDETDLSYFHARMLQARAGRFTRPDAIYDGLFEPQRWNRYAYALNSPVDTTDAFGLDPCPPGVFCGNSVPACTTFNCDIGPGANSHAGITFVDFWPINVWNLIGYGSSHPGPTNSGVGSNGSGSGPTNPTNPTNPAPPGPPPSVPPAGPAAPPSVASCFIRGALTGAAGAVIVGGGVVVASALGAPAAVVTGALGAVAVVGGVTTVLSTTSQALSGNWASVAYNGGAIAGGSAVGYLGGNMIASTISSTASRGWSLARDIGNRYIPSMGTLGQWLGTAPDGGSAGGAAAAGGAGAAVPARRGCR